MVVVCGKSCRIWKGVDDGGFGCCWSFARFGEVVEGCLPWEDESRGGEPPAVHIAGGVKEEGRGEKSFLSALRKREKVRGCVWQRKERKL